MSPSPFQIHVPATTANLGPGFDILGIALDVGTNLAFRFEGDHYQLFDVAGAAIPIPPEKNLIAKAYERVLLASEVAPAPWTAVVESDLLPGRGFGSSAMALVAGVILANEQLNALGKNAWTLQQQIALLCEMEGHPDNVIPARVGGWICSLPQGQYARRNLPDHFGIQILIPEKQTSTNESRVQLPKQYSLEDCVTNLRGLAAWFDYIDSGNGESLKVALQCDRLHEPYRTPQIPGFQEIRNTAMEAGCLGSSLSGSGPGLAVFFDRNQVAESGLQRISDLAVSYGYTSRICGINNQGARKITSSQKEVQR